MNNRNWFRNTEWNEEIEEYFFLKLRRVRSKNMQTQYLVLQAGALPYRSDKELRQVSKMLLLKLLADYPDEIADRSVALNILGDIYECENDYQKALDYHKQAVDFEEIFPYSISNSFMDYSELVVKTNRTDLYDDVEEILLSERYSNFLMFPYVGYKKYSILSIVCKHKGDMENAKKYAELADYNANLRRSGFAKHQSLGLVDDRDKILDELVKGD